MCAHAHGCVLTYALVYECMHMCMVNIQLCAIWILLLYNVAVLCRGTQDFSDPCIEEYVSAGKKCIPTQCHCVGFAISMHSSLYTWEKFCISLCASPTSKRSEIHVA